jgi:hypothetical protein
MGRISVGALMKTLRGRATRSRRLAVLATVCTVALGTGVAIAADSTATLRVTGAYRATLSLASTGTPFGNACMAVAHINPGAGVFLYFSRSKPTAGVFISLYTSGSAHNLNLATTHRGVVTLHRFSPGADWFAGYGGKESNRHYGSGTLSISADAMSGSINATLQRDSGPKRPINARVTWHCSPPAPK